MLRFLKSKVTLMLSIFFGLGLVSLSAFSSLKSAQLNSRTEIHSRQNITKSYSELRRRTIYKSRNSAVNVMSISPDGGLASSSGTYIRYNQKYYIMTVSHGIQGPCDLIRIVVGENMYECLELSMNDRKEDYALIEVGRIPELAPVQMPHSLPKGSEWRHSLSIHTDIVYTGYPNSIGPLTIDGKIVGYGENDLLFLHSFAWPGSSGSGVFSEDGKLIGYVMAVNLGFTEYGIGILEDIVIIAPAYKIDWEQLKQ